jgi:hypothetical protein
MPAAPMRPALLRLALTGGIREDEAVDGLRRAAAALNAPLEAVEREIAALVAEGLLYDPVRLPPGALKCHWRLEPTPQGAALAASAGEGYQAPARDGPT